MNPNQLDTAGKTRQQARLFAAIKKMEDFDTLYIPSPHDGVIAVGSVFRSGPNRYQAFTGIGDTGAWLGEFSSATNALAYTRKDLKAVIQVQEATVKAHGAASCPKLGEYWDDLCAVLNEMRLRGAGGKHRCSCGALCAGAAS